MLSFLSECPREIRELIAHDVTVLVPLAYTCTTMKEHLYQLKDQFCEACTKEGFRSLLVWGHENGCPVEVSSFCEACRRGDLDLVICLTNLDCNWSPEAMKLAAAEGHLHVLKWARQFGFRNFYDHAIEGAFSQRRYDIASWAANYTFKNSAYEEQLKIMCWASKFGDLNAIERLYMEGGEDIFDVEQAVCHGHLHVLEWWKGLGNSFETFHAERACGAGHLHLVMWFHEQGIEMNAQCCEVAAREGHLEVLQWLRNHDVPWNPRIMAFAASQAPNVLALKWVIEQGCPWDRHCLQFCLYHGDLEILRYIVENDPLKSTVISSAAAMSVDAYEKLHFLREKGFDWDENVTRVCANKCRLKALKWAIANGCPWDRQKIFETAASGDLPMMKWVFEEMGEDPNNYTSSITTSLGLAAHSNDLQLVKWLDSKGYLWTEQNLQHQLRASSDPRIREIEDFHSRNNSTVFTSLASSLIKRLIV